jgi:hypothetical protein
MKKISLVTVVLVALLFSCQKNIDKPATQEEIQTSANSNNENGQLQQTKKFSADVVIRWLNMQLICCGCHWHQVLVHRMPAGHWLIVALQRMNPWFLVCQLIKH